MSSKQFALREQMATVLDIILCVRDAESGGKTTFTSQEFIEFLYAYAQNKQLSIRNTAPNTAPRLDFGMGG